MRTRSFFGGNLEHIKVSKHTKDELSYLDYQAIFGDDDNGKMMIDAKLDEKKKVGGVRANHLYLFYVNKRGK